MSKSPARDALCALEGVRIRHRNRAKRQRFPVPAWRFREARHALGLTVPATADLLRICERTVRGWESGATRIPYAAFKLLRVLKGGRLLDHPHWKDFQVRGPVLWTPEGHALQAGDLAWLSLLVRRARAFSALLHAGRTPAPGPEHVAAAAAAPPVSGTEPAAPAGRVDARPRPLVASAGPARPSATDSGPLPSSNRGVSETERRALGALSAPLLLRVATLPKAGVAARPRLAAARRVCGDYGRREDADNHQADEAVGRKPGQRPSAPFKRRGVEA